MRELKESVRKKSAIDPTMDERYADKVLFQHKIDRLNKLLKGTKLDPTIANSQRSV